MKEEVSHAVDFICERLKKKVQDLPDEKVEHFKTTIQRMIFERFEKHWHPTKPLKGNAFRCLNIEDGCLDPFLIDVMKVTVLEVSELKTAFPQGMALWIDPDDVSCRLGKGSITPIYKNHQFKEVQVSTSKPTTFTSPVKSNTRSMYGYGRYSPPSSNFSRPADSRLTTGRYSPPNDIYSANTCTAERYSQSNFLSSPTPWNSSWSAQYESNQGQRYENDGTVYFDNFYDTNSNNYNNADADIWRKQISRYNNQKQSQRYSINKHTDTSYGRYHWYNQDQSQSDLRSYSSEYEIRTVAQTAY